MDKKTAFERLIPVCRPFIGQDELTEVAAVFKSNWLGMGKWVFEFENKIKEFVGGRNVIAVNTGTTALHLALESLGIKEGDEVIVPSLTFAASVQAIAACRAKPVFCDIYEDTLNCDVEDIRRKISKKTKVIMPVHYSGLSCEMDSIISLTKKHNLRVVEDAAHAFGSVYKGRRIGSFGDIACFSFDPIKNITCGEGGAIVTNDVQLTEIMIKKRILGIDKDTWSRYEHRRDWFYNVGALGFRYHMNNINAAIGLVQLKKLDAFVDRKRKIVKKYDQELSGINGIEILRRDYVNTAPFNYIIKIKKDRDGLIEFLKTHGIDSGVHYIPNHLQPFFRPYRIPLPVTEKVWQEIITLPLYYEMAEEDVNRVVFAVKEFFSKDA